MENEERESLGKLGAWLGVVGNLLLITVKVIAGILGGSQGLIAEAIHSSADLISSLGVLVGVKVSNRPPDQDHPLVMAKLNRLQQWLCPQYLSLQG